MKPHAKIRVYCVDDHAIVARGLRAAVQVEPDMEWAGWQSKADELIEAFDEHKPDVVLLDIDMPGTDPFLELSELVELRSGARALILSSSVREGHVDAAIESGARGFVSKGEEFDVIFDAVRRVASGEFVFPDEALARCEVSGDRLRIKGRTASRFAALSPREMQVLRLIAQGRSTKEIAELIHRSVKRVESIRTSIMRKVEVSDRLELTRLAIREGIVEA